MENLWKEAFPVGTEWDQYEKVYDIDWDFTHLEEAFEEGGVLHNKRVWLFGCTEPQMVNMKDGDQDVMKGIHIPAVTAVVATHPPSDKLGVKSVQMVEENIIPMKEMKMDWVPFIPEDIADRKSVERFKAQIFVLKCTQRRAVLKRMREEKLKKYEYCLPYIFNPIKDKDPPADTVVQIMYSFEDEKQPPIVTEFDWKFDEEEDFLERMENEEGLPKSEREKFWAYCQEQGKTAKAQLMEERAKRKAVIDAIPEPVMDSFRNMKVFKFYPQKSDDAPDIQEFKSSFVNRYYGKADEIFPPVEKKEAGFGGGNIWAQFSQASAPKADIVPPVTTETVAATSDVPAENGTGNALKDADDGVKADKDKIESAENGTKAEKDEGKESELAPANGKVKVVAAKGTKGRGRKKQKVEAESAEVEEEKEVNAAAKDEGIEEESVAEDKIETSGDKEGKVAAASMETKESLAS